MVLGIDEQNLVGDGGGGWRDRMAIKWVDCISRQTFVEGRENRMANKWVAGVSGQNFVEGKQNGKQVGGGCIWAKFCEGKTEWQTSGWRVYLGKSLWREGVTGYGKRVKGVPGTDWQNYVEGTG